MWWWTHDAGVLYKVPVTFPLTSSHMPTASCGRKGKGVTLAPILNKEKQRGQGNVYKGTQQKGYYDKVKPPRQGRLKHPIYSSQGCYL